MGKIGVIGSLNVDLTVNVPRFHAPGETITGSNFSTFTGGKGGNQAVAAAKLGAEVVMVGKLGVDAYGDLYAETLQSLGIRMNGVERVESVPTGVALIEVDAAGENRIIVVPGANALVDTAQIDRQMTLLGGVDVALFQLEIPLESVKYAMRRLREAEKAVILDPAPAAALDGDFLALADYLTPNETELSILSGMAVETEEQIECAARTLLDKGARSLVVKMGAKGAMIVGANGARIVSGFKVHALDTTAAGDSFNAGLAFALSGGMELFDAVRFANAVGALSTTAHGAQGAMPTLREVEALMRSAG